MSLFKKLITSCKQNEFFQNWLQIHRNTANTTETRGLIHYYLINRIFQALSEANHSQIEYLSDELIKKNDSIGYLYQAQSFSLQNKVIQAEQCLQHFLNQNPYHADATYLLAELKARKGDKESAFQLLEHLLSHSNRRKTWQHLSNLIENKIDFKRFVQLFNQNYPNYQTQSLKYDLICHLSNAAMRAKQVDFALSLWRMQYYQARLHPIKYNAVPPKKFTDEKAAHALLAVKKYLDKNSIPFFLISGTLLGCIRENKLLRHDKDIDIGVWDDYTVTKLQELFQNSGCFYVLPIYSKDILVIRHTNGITVDIFIHYREQNDYWHAGGKSKWHNSPFGLIPYHFLNEHYLIPENYDLYLSENYGNWKISKTDFDNTLDTTNVEITSIEEFIIYLYKKIIFSLQSNHPISPRYLKQLQEYEEI